MASHSADNARAPDRASLASRPADNARAFETLLRNRVRARLVNYLRDEARRRNQHVRLHLANLGSLATAPQSAPDALSPRLRSAMRALSPVQRSVIHQVYWEEKRLAVVARESARTPQEVSRVRRRAIGRLRQALGGAP